MAHIVTCYYCNERFDRDKEPFVQVSARRYCHKECAPKEKQVVVNKQEQDYNNLIEYIKKLYKVPAVLPSVVKQIKEFKQQYGFTYTGMRKTLYWYYELKNNSITKSNGQIGIIPYVYNQANDYFYRLYLAEIASQYQIDKLPPKEYTIRSPEKMQEYKPKKIFDLGEEEVNG